jgi:hypothetical protein
MKSSPSKQNVLARKHGVTSKQNKIDQIMQIKNEKLALLNEVMNPSSLKLNRSCQKIKEVDDASSIKIPLSPGVY